MYAATILAIGIAIEWLTISLLRDIRKARKNTYQHLSLMDQQSIARVAELAQTPLRTVSTAQRYTNASIDPIGEMTKAEIRSIRRIQKLYDYRHKMLCWYDEHRAYGLKMADADKKNRKGWLAYAQNAEDNATSVENMTIDTFEAWLDRQTAIESLQKAGLVA